jgi:adenylate kinase family enzyme
MMSKILIFGNSGAGKSTLAKKIAANGNKGHLDLDTLAWLLTTPVQRAPLAESYNKMITFINNNTSWVIEGCYVDLLQMVVEYADEIIFLNLSVNQCVENAKNRPWEPHKYQSIEEQNQNLQMLIDWIEQYPCREGEFSLNAHQKFYDHFTGKKMTITNNEQC